ncbi:MAG: YgjV family protein [Candidatus Gracilibacteria bacterium]|nr:YgjV family protein [Candidatus Gracilibacteria bacterium]MDD5178884.1 YgjV family protein [Candidatus Gracilibacteria bacterium]
MFELTASFVSSQILMLAAMVLGFASLQFRARKHIFLTLAIGAGLISAHYFLLGKVAAGVIVSFSVLRFVTAIFTSDKKYILIFLALNTIALFFTYKEIYDLLVFFGIAIIVIGNFQASDKHMRSSLIFGTSLVLLYNTLIFSPMGIVEEGSFLISNLIGYFRFHIKKQKPPKIITSV